MIPMGHDEFFVLLFIYVNIIQNTIIYIKRVVDFGKYFSAWSPFLQLGQALADAQSMFSQQILVLNIVKKSKYQQKLFVLYPSKKL